MYNIVFFVKILELYKVYVSLPADCLEQIFGAATVGLADGIQNKGDTD